MTTTALTREDRFALESANAELDRIDEKLDEVAWALDHIIPPCDICDGAGVIPHYPPGCLDILEVDCAACDGTGELQ